MVYTRNTHSMDSMKGIKLIFRKLATLTKIQWKRRTLNSSQTFFITIKIFFAISMRIRLLSLLIFCGVFWNISLFEYLHKNQEVLNLVT